MAAAPSSSSKSSALSLADEALPKVKVHATAVFSMLNHYIRREGRENRVIGTLLGSVAPDGVVHVKDCYGVPFKESASDEKLYVGIDEAYHQSMYGFLRRVNKKEVILGWYASTTPDGALLIDQSSMINDWYTRKTEYGAASPIHLVVDTTLAGDSVPVRGFMSRPVKVGAGNLPLANMFLELEVEVCLSDSEATAMYHMINGQAGPMKFSRAVIVSQCSSEKSRLVPALERLLTTLAGLQKYCDAVVSGALPPSASIGVALSDALSALQSLPSDELKALLDDRAQDLLLVQYLATLTRTQLKISEKLSAML